MSDEQAAPAGWYPDPEMAATQRYWDGAQWTDHRAPMAAGVSGPTRACPYCANHIAEAASRCQHCAGQLFACPRCRQLVGATTRSKFVGVARGGTKTQYRCMQCNGVVGGPRW